MTNRFRFRLSLLRWLTCFFVPILVVAAEVDQDKTVRVVYLVSKDREVPTDYPGKAYLTDKDKKILLRSPFFFTRDGKPLASKESFTEKLHYGGGCLGKFAESDQPCSFKAGNVRTQTKM